MVASKNIKEHPHFTSWHSLLGLATMAATVLQAICGVFLIFPNLISTCSFPRLRLYHATCGLMAYLLATVTVMAAMFTDWFQASVTGTVWYIFLLLPLFPALVVMNQITSAFLPKKKITSWKLKPQISLFIWTIVGFRSSTTLWWHKTNTHFVVDVHSHNILALCSFGYFTLYVYLQSCKGRDRNTNFYIKW